MIYAASSRHFNAYLTAPTRPAPAEFSSAAKAASDAATAASVAALAAQEASGAPQGVLSAHHIVAEFAGVQVPGPHARFVTQRYMRYAQVNKELSLPPQDEWHTPVGAKADTQSAAIAEEAEGALSQVIASLKPGDLVEIEWVQVALGNGRQIRACQKMERLTADGVAAAEAKYPEVQILGLDSATEALLERAGADPAARSACHNAMQEPALAEALKEMARTGRPPAGTRTTDLRAHALWATLIARGVRLELDCPECEVFGEPAGDPRAPVPIL